MKTKKIVIIIAFLMIVNMLLISNYVEADKNEQNRGIRDFDERLTFTEGSREGDRDEIHDYLIHDNFPGDWCDAEKTVEDTEDGKQCWAAAASNVLDWTGWGIGVEPGINDCDDIFQEFQDHWKDVGGFEHNGWIWWFNGTAPAGQVDVAGGGDYYPSLTWSDYFHQTWYDGRTTFDGLPVDSYDLMEGLDHYLHQGWGVTLGFSYHAITAWGFSYNSSVDPSDFANYYTGIYVTDSDDDKTNDPDPANPNEADEYPDRLRYYELRYTDDNRWILPSYGGGSQIDSFFAFEPMDNQNPVADAGPDQTINEGDTVNFDGSGSSDADGDTLTYDWDFNDGTTGSGVNPSHTYCDSGVYTVSLTVEDGHGGEDTDTMIVTVSNLPPTADAGPNDTIDEGDNIAFTGTAGDVGCDELTYEWDFGDGSPVVTGTLNPTHIYCDNGIYTVTLEVSDGDGGVATDYATITVNNIAPTAIADADEMTVDEGYTISFDSSDSIDPGTCDDRSWEWHFGDGTTSTEENPTHVYGDNGVFDVTLTVTDDDGGSDSDTLTITVNNVAPTAHDLGFGWCDENTVRPMIVQNINDPGSDDITITWDWGDGIVETSPIYYNDGINPDPSQSPDINPVEDLGETKYHIYGDNGDFTVTVTIEDDDGGVVVVTGSIRVDNVNPTVDLIDPITVDENTPFTLSGHATDQGSDDLTFTWNWGDGTSDTITYYNDGSESDPYPSPEINPMDITDMISHTYGDNGKFLVTLTVEDDDLGATVVTTNVTVNNVAPIIDPFGPFVIDENTPITFIGHVTDPGSDDLTLEWNIDYGSAMSTTYYNDGSESDPYPSPEINPMDITETVPQIYGDDGLFTLTLTAYDDDGGSTTVTTTITVNNVNPVISSEISMEWPYPENPGFILPGEHDLDFTATAYDQGSDDLTFNWDWDDGSTTDNTYYNNEIGADPYPSPEIDDITVTETVTHTYTDPGTYSVILTITDDDGGMVTSVIFEVIVLDIDEALDHINNYIQGLDDSYFKGKADKRKNAFDNMFDAMQDMFLDEDYNGIIQDLNNNVRAKCDGEIDGKKNDDWITDYSAQYHICMKIDDLTSYLYTYL